jgi:hypothetical protein
MFDNGIQLRRRCNEAEFIRVRIRKLAVDIYLVAIEAVR